MPDQRNGYQYGVHGRPHPDRARQFMPFASLKGYYDLIAQRTQEVEQAVHDADFAGERHREHDEDPL